jgi:hypothetical protein
VYRVVFDAADKPLAWWFPAIPLALLGLCVLWRRYASTESQRASALLGIVGLPIMTALFALFVVVPRAQALSALASGRYDVVEGIVEDFQPLPAKAQGTRERFRVGIVVFDYRTNEVSPGFNQTSAEGGPIRDGLPVRITYILSSSRPPKAVILRLEIAE